MHNVSTKALAATGWLAVVCVAGLIGGASSVSTWALLVGGAALPPIVMFWRWSDPPQTLSESIREARH